MHLIILNLDVKIYVV